jgi:hypothetical protein
VYIDDGFCSSSAVEFDPDGGCLTYSEVLDLMHEGVWDDESLDEGWEDIGFEDVDDQWFEDDN